VSIASSFFSLDQSFRGRDARHKKNQCKIENHSKFYGHAREGATGFESVKALAENQLAGQQLWYLAHASIKSST
jgi:hypothetical protein